jgi:hypothetical protein
VIVTPLAAGITAKPKLLNKGVKKQPCHPIILLKNGVAGIPPSTASLIVSGMPVVRGFMGKGSG